MAKTAKQRIDKALEAHGIVEAKADSILGRIVKLSATWLIILAYTLVCVLATVWVGNWMAS